jgi:hypothetical protein
MTDATDLLEALVAIVKDPKAWDKRVAAMREAAGDLAEAKQLKKDTDNQAAQAAKDVETAHYERGQAERALRDAAAQAAANDARARELANGEAGLKSKQGDFATEQANWKTNVENREYELTVREAAAAEKLKKAEELMAGYDEAKHQAALKLAS